MKDLQTRKKEAEERMRKHGLLTTSQKIVKLDLKHGAGVGSKKERTKLALKIAQEHEEKSKPAHDASVQILKNSKKPYQKPKKS